MGSSSGNKREILKGISIFFQFKSVTDFVFNGIKKKNFKSEEFVASLRGLKISFFVLGCPELQKLDLAAGSQAKPIFNTISAFEFSCISSN